MSLSDNFFQNQCDTTINTKFIIKDFIKLNTQNIFIKNIKTKINILNC